MQYLETIQTSFVIIQESSIHNKGGFAACDIAKGTRIIQYVGEKISKAEGDRRDKEQKELAKSNPEQGAVYVFELNENYDIDGSFSENPARYLNHSCEPNCRYSIENDQIWIIALRDIKKDEELTFNYDFGLEDLGLFPCRCRSSHCFGYILAEEDWPQGRALLAKKYIILES